MLANGIRYGLLMKDLTIVSPGKKIVGSPEAETNLTRALQVRSYDWQTSLLLSDIGFE